MLAVPVPGGAVLSICAVVGDDDLVRVRAAAAGMCSVWHSRGVSAVGFGQAPSYAELRLVPRQLGQTAELAGGIPALPDQLGERISLRRDGGGLGTRTDGSRRYFGPGRR